MTEVDFQKQNWVSDKEIARIRIMNVAVGFVIGFLIGLGVGVLL